VRSSIFALFTVLLVLGSAARGQTVTVQVDEREPAAALNTAALALAPEQREAMLNRHSRAGSGLQFERNAFSDVIGRYPASQAPAVELRKTRIPDNDSDGRRLHAALLHCASPAILMALEDHPSVSRRW
jgi:hypothetical protein